MTTDLDRSLLEGIIASWVSRYGAFRPGLDSEGAASLMLEEALSSDLVLYQGDHAGSRSLVYCKSAHWDSKMLGIRVGRFSFLSSEPDHLDDEKRELVSRFVELASGRFDLLIGRLDSRDVSSLHALEDGGFRIMDTLITLTNESIVGYWSINVRPYTPSDRPYLEAIGKQSFRMDHYHADPRLSPVLCDNLYLQWVRNACDGRAAAVLVCDADSEPSGFITCLVETDNNTGRKRGIIDLVAVSPASQGQGLGVQLVSSALAWFRGQGVEHVEVGTQVSNIQAMRLYQRLGFHVFRSVYTVHGWLAARAT